MRTFHGIDELRSATGSHLGSSPWHQITQEQIRDFAQATGDHQWIHLDVEKARQGPFGTTVAHGYLTLSLLPMLISQIYAVEGVSLAINYGANRFRLPAPVPVGSRIRASAHLIQVVPRSLGFEVETAVTVDLEGSAKPAVVIDMLAVLVP